MKELSSATAALFIAILSGLGVGSGGLLVIWLTAVEGLSSSVARGLNLLFFVFSASAALCVHLKRGRLRLKMVSVLALCASLGTIAGSLIGLVIDPYILKKIFGAMLVLSGGYTAFGRVKSIFLSAGLKKPTNQLNK